jgi:hypothetical protein
VRLLIVWQAIQESLNRLRRRQAPNQPPLPRGERGD